MVFTLLRQVNVYSISFLPISRYLSTVQFSLQRLTFVLTDQWLHLSAYSWGGLADVKPDAAVGKEGSSQIHPNFVLGTSETNSAMTR